MNNHFVPLEKSEGIDEVLNILLKMGFIKLNLGDDYLMGRFKGIDTFINRSGVVIFGLKDGKGYALMEACMNAREAKTGEALPISFNSVSLGGRDLIPFLSLVNSFNNNASFVMPWTEKPEESVYRGFEPLLDDICEKMPNADQEFFGADDLVIKL